MEKKLTDEEIVKAIDKCFAMPMKCEDGCPYFNKYGRNFCVEDKRFYHDVKDLIQRQKAEIQNLTKRINDGISACMECCEKKDDKIADLKEERENMEREILVLEEDNRRLKGYIDFKTANVMCDKCKEKAVKDTAREIWCDCIDKIMRGCGDDKEFWVIEILIKTFKKYGVGFDVE